jgi:hypothetical protein
MHHTPSDSELVAAYLRYFDTNDESLFWAWERIEDVVLSDPECGWSLILTLVAEAANERCLSYVAAGPLENMLNRHGDAVIARVELQARRDPKFRLALSNVWGTSRAEGDVFARVRVAVGSGSNFRWSGP